MRDEDLLLELDPEERLLEPVDEPDERLLEPVDEPEERLLDPVERLLEPVDEPDERLLDPVERPVELDLVGPDRDVPVERVVPLDLEVVDPEDLDVLLPVLRELPVELVPVDLVDAPLRLDVAREVVRPLLIVVRELVLPELTPPIVDLVERIGVADFPAELELPDVLTIVRPPLSANPAVDPPATVPLDPDPVNPPRPLLRISSSRLVNALRAMEEPRAP